jgi:hypothetical protein
VAELGQEGRLAGESAGIVGVRRAQEFERQVMPTSAVTRVVHIAASARANHGDPLIAGVQQRRRGLFGVRHEHRLERPAELRGGLRAIIGVDGERRGQDCAEILRHVRR